MPFLVINTFDVKFSKDNVKWCTRKGSLYAIHDAMHLILFIYFIFIVKTYFNRIFKTGYCHKVDKWWEWSR